MKIGPYTISSIVTHHFALDGGAMFGVVPKPLWSRVIEADERNRIPMLTRILVLDSARERILIDLGCGDKFNEKMRDIYDCKRQTDSALHKVIPDVTHCLITHLHFDHVGGVSYLDRQGQARLSFPDAGHLISKRHWEYGQKPNPREKASFLPENLKPLSTAKLTLVEDGQEVLENIRVWESDGHTKGMLWVEIFDEKNSMIFASDVVPTSHHLPLPYIMGYDMCAETMIAEKQRFLQKCCEQNSIVVFEHDRHVAAARVSATGGRVSISEQVEIPVFSRSTGVA